MQIQVDTREHKAEWERIEKQFKKLKIEYFRSKLYVGDYMNLDNPRVVIDRKKNLSELAQNVTQGHERFVRELKRARNAKIKVIVLVEHSNDIKTIGDVWFWQNPRRNITDWVTINGKPQRVQKYPRAITGQQLYKAMCTIRDKYNVTFAFCNKANTGQKIYQLLE